MPKIPDHELVQIIAEALQFSGTPGNAERLRYEAALGRASVIMAALNRAVLCHQL
jgi:hypothetical protein